MARSHRLLDHGLLLQKYPYSETSLITVWFTPQHGRIKLLWKGARNPRSPFHGRIDYFQRSHLAWLPTHRSEIHTATEILVEHLHHQLPRSYPATTVGLYCAELLHHLTPLEDPDPALYTLLDKAWAWLDSHPPTPHFVARFERALTIALGFADDQQSPDAYRPILDQHLANTPRSRPAVNALF